MTTQIKPISPSGLGAAAVGGGGTFAANTYFWRITAVNGSGESIGSNEASATVALNGHADLTWTFNPPGTTGIKIYRGTVSGQNTTLVAFLPSPALAYSDTGIAGSAATTPASGTFQNIVKVGPCASKSTAGISSAFPGHQHLALYAMNLWIAGAGLGSVAAMAQAKINAAGFALQEV